MIRAASQVQASPMAYDAAFGSRRTPAYVIPKIAPVLRPCSVHRRGSGLRRAASSDTGTVPAGLSDAFEELIVHRQKTGAGRIAHRPELAALGGIDRRNRDARQSCASPPELDEHLGFNLIATRLEWQISQRVEAAHAEPALRVVHGAPTNHDRTRLPIRFA